MDTLMLCVWYDDGGYDEFAIAGVVDYYKGRVVAWLVDGGRVELNLGHVDRMSIFHL